ncbi:MAG: ABC transporter ATP-binding protein [Phenylobacterium sp.]|uniref:ABC transporter ATP-binding protein n=1 Tax=Phenylobacterium sp. TaxID=1871053 RepID=UPI0027346CD8|nr:ABC transporter ATP-binding protein [Phenylobacterium sp.]MDP1640859.1 ABC transporter ATP-binding protein [Phenylobacterium sp.]MDP3116072.1 ABC transporter ATP-binding protein [Phenylobacterium sp.]MDP3385305.1 ABC transporter ATP-binding protein [Phenylobacterium sp.]
MPAGPPPLAPPLKIADLAKSVPGGRLLFSNLALDMAPGEIVAIMGESGVGKSTLLNLIAGLDRADAGRIEIDGVDLSTLDDDARTGLRRDRIGFVFQAFHILPHLTLAQNVALPLILARRPEAEALKAAAAMLDQVGLGGRGQDFPAQVSGGEMQRIALARALVHRPALVLADEPTGNLDPQTADVILALLCDQLRGSGAAAVIVTHSERAAAAADRVLTLTAHGLVAHGR